MYLQVVLNVKQFAHREKSTLFGLAVVPTFLSDYQEPHTELEAMPINERRMLTTGRGNEGIIITPKLM